MLGKTVHNTVFSVFKSNKVKSFVLVSGYFAPSGLTMRFYQVPGPDGPGLAL